jgi:hypothetical protein
VQQPTPRRYRIRIVEKNYEVLTDRQYAAVLDFSPGPGLRATEGQLDGLVTSLAYAAGARGQKTLDYYLAVHDWDTGELKCHWPAKTWVDTSYS